MRCWPLSVIRTSPLLPGDCAWELDAVCETYGLSQRASDACGYVAGRTKPVQMDGLVECRIANDLVPHFVYTARPPLQQWQRLERAVMTDADAGYVVIISTLH
jgi:hypothetical protein